VASLGDVDRVVATTAVARSPVTTDIDHRHRDGCLSFGLISQHIGDADSNASLCLAVAQRRQYCGIRSVVVASEGLDARNLVFA
jgi:hypothetical protein